MATYAQLYDIGVNNALLDNVTAAVAVQAEVIRTENGATTNHANRLLWAKDALSDPRAMAGRMVWAVIAQKSSLTPAQIRQLSDADVLAAVAAAVDVFATGA